jgi:hypothetical protein
MAAPLAELRSDIAAALARVAEAETVPNTSASISRR